MHYKLVTFDITGTILKLRKPVGEMYANAGKIFGITDIDPDVLAVNFGKEWTKMNKDHPNFGLHSDGWEIWWKEVVKSTFKNSTEKKISSEKLGSLSSYLIKLYSTKKGWSCEEGSVELLRYLNSCNVQVGIISNFDMRLHNVLHELELRSFFSFILTSYETSFLKPDINIFKIAQKKFEDIAGLKFDERFALHVGNSLETDVEGARRAGWAAALISNDLSLNKLKNSDCLLFKNLSDLRHFVSR